MPHTFPSRPFLALLAAAAALLPAAPAAAQRIVEQEEPTFFEIVEVNVVNLEVFVTDRDGHFVPGLTQDDFEVLEDGKPVEITNFYVSGGGGEAGSPAQAGGGLGTLAQAVPAFLDDVPVPEEQRLNLVFFIDNQNIFPTDRNRLIQAIEGFVTKSALRPSDRLLLVSYDGPGSLQIHQPPTRDRTAFTAALRQIALGSANGLNRSAERRHMLFQLENGIEPPDDDDDLLKDIAASDARATYAGVRLYAQARYDESRRTVAAIGQFIDSLGGLPGRKALVYVSGGMSLHPAEAMFLAWTNKYREINREYRIGTPEQDSLQFDTTPLLEGLAGRANANRVTLYALGAVEELASNTSSSRGGSIWGTLEESTESFNLAKSLHLITGPTGGFAAVDAVSAESALIRISRDFESYYSIGYTPPPGRAPGRHAVEVRVKNPKLKVRHRDAHRDRNVYERMSDRTLSALFLGGGDNPLAVSLLFEDEITGARRDEYVVTLMIKMPMANVVLLPKDQYHEGRVMVFLGARDKKGRTSGITQVAVPIRVPNAELLTALGQTVAYRARLVLKKGDYTVAVGVRDELGNVGSTVTAAYVPGRPDTQAGR